MVKTSATINTNIKVDKPTHVIKMNKQVIKVEMSQFEWSHNLICVAHPDEIIIGIVKFQV